MIYKTKKKKKGKKKVIISSSKNIGHRISDIGPDGKEYNIKKDKYWVDKK